MSITFLEDYKDAKIRQAIRTKLLKEVSNIDADAYVQVIEKELRQEGLWDTYICERAVRDE